MTNNFVPDLTDLQSGELARATDINLRYSYVVSGFDKLPAPVSSGQGFSDPVPVGTPTGDTHAVTKAYADANYAGSASPTFTGTATLATANATTLGATTFNIGGVEVTATAAELNILDGITASTAELNIMDGVTATTSEINTLDGVTATAAEINTLAGVSAGAIANNKGVVYGSGGEVNATKLQIAGSDVTASTSELNKLDGVTASTSELNLLDGVTSTTAELNIIDGDKAAVSTTLADADRVVVNDAGTMKQVALTDVKTYLESGLTNLSSVTGVSSLTSGSIGSGFGAIDVGSNAITSTGTVTFGSLSDGAITVTAFIDEDDMSSDSATALPTQQSVKAYVDANSGSSDVSSDTTPQLGGNLDVNGNSIVSASAGNISITPDGAGKIILDGLSWPTADGTADHVIKTDGSGNLSFTAQTGGGGGGGGASVSVSETAPGSPSSGDLWYDPNSAETFVYYNDGDSNQWVQTNPASGGVPAASGISDVVSDTTPQLGGNLDTNSQSIVSVSNANIPITPDGSGKIVLDGLSWPTADGSADQVLKTNGSGVLSFVDQSGGGGGGGGSGGVTVYADLDALPLTGVTEGSLALVDSTDRLYVWSDSGWYNIALVNTTPTVSGANASYDLDNTGSATVVTLTATDPEGIPVTYSIASDTSGSIATVVQGTGASTNVFTITPSTSEANAGTFSLTFRASDGVNIGTAVSSFTLKFVVTNSQYTRALVTALGANTATNSSVWDDESTNDLTINVTGTPQQSSFTPYREGGWSTYFDGTGDLLDFADTGASFGTGDFTVEMWIYPDAIGSENIIFDTRSAADTAGLAIMLNGGVLKTFDNNATRTTGTTTFTAGMGWVHIAVVRDSTSMRAYVAGSKDGEASSYTGSITNDANKYRLGAGIPTANNFNGIIRDVRVVNGTALYTGSSLTIPTEPLTAVTNTRLLACNNVLIKDGSSLSNAATITGHVCPTSMTPYAQEDAFSTSYSGSLFIDGSTGNYVENDASASTALGSGDWTIEGWVYSTQASDWQFIFDARDGTSTGAPCLYFNNTNGWQVWIGAAKFDGGSYRLNTWHHWALVKSSGTTAFYVDGVSQGSWSDSTTYDNDRFRIGSRYSNADPIHGNLADFRVVVGTAVYTSAFTPPTSKLTAITNTALLLPFNDGGIVDMSQTSQFVAIADGCSASSTQNKFRTTSMYFDGTDARAEIKAEDGAQAFNLGSQDFTYEAWVYNTQGLDSGNNHLIVTHGSNVQYSPVLLYTNKLYMSSDWASWDICNGDTWSCTQNSWVHVAVVRNGSSIKLYADGTSIISKTFSGSFGDVPASRNIFLGASSNSTNDFTGYIEDFRLSIGLARYTSNFTPPSAALAG